MGFDISDMFTVRFSKEDLEALKNILAEMKNPVEVITFVGDICAFCSETVKLIDTLAMLSPKVDNATLLRHQVYHYRRDGAEVFKKYGISRIPSVVMLEGQIRYIGMPAGEELRGFIETILRISSGDSSLSKKTSEMLSKVSKRVRIEVIVTPTCPYCPYAAFLANMFAFEAYKNGNRNIVSDIVEAYENPDIADKYGVTSVPAIVLNGEVEFIGVPEEFELLSRILEKLRRPPRTQYQ
ncbi:MAG: thioredoxin family protein [Desulfurococcaceae archaeon]|jgi:glutaredoxin-like protein|nr:thioredoxin family protein [Desulfurococcaceae archaeon]